MQGRGVCEGGVSHDGIRRARLLVKLQITSKSCQGLNVTA